MKDDGKLQIGLGVALLSTFLLLPDVNKIIVIVLGAFLIVSGFVVCFHRRISHLRWNRIVKTCSNIDVRDTAYGFGLVIAGAGLMRTPVLPLGITLILVGAWFIGTGLGENIKKFCESMKRQHK